MSASTRPRVRRRTRLITTTLGAALTLLTIALDWTGQLATLERWCYDQRIARCQQQTPAPTEALVHIDITDEALEKIGRWPWDRWKLAWIVDELRLAGAKVIALDILFNEPQLFDAPTGRVDPGYDQALAESLAQHGKVVIAVDPDLGEPVESIRQAAAGLGLVQYPPSPDGVSRFVSLRHHNQSQSYAHLALQLAAHYLDADDRAISFLPQYARVQTPQRTITIPIIDGQAPVGLDANMLIPWFGDPGENAWRTLYDWPAHQNAEAAHVSVFDLWNAARDDKTINLIARDFTQRFRQGAEPPTLTENAPRATREAFIDDLLAQISEMLTYYPDSDELVDDERVQRDELIHMRDALQTIRANCTWVEKQRGWLRQKVNGKAALVGFVATGLLDQTVTPLHPQAPGVIVHGVVFNSILTGEFWRQTPFAYTAVITLAMGLLTSLIVSRQGPILSTLAAAGLMLGYALINGLVLFDMQNLVVDMAGPMTAMAAVWVGGIVMRFVSERLERARVEKRFRSYVDPTLVDYVLDHPAQTKLDGEQREMTVVFTDLADFTTLSEQLREKTVPLLSEYFERMAPLIRENGGYVNKFLGDGMMFFYGAPIENRGHALHAVSAVMRMQENLLAFNEILAQRGLPLLGMRAGVGSGKMTVGDVGPADACDYTVLGDTVNLAARLESANKATDTQVLINHRTAELVGDHFLLRPIGNLQVVGKSEGVFIYEPLAPLDQVDNEQKQLVDDTLGFINAFVGRQFKECMELVDAFETTHGADKLTHLYRQHCSQHLAHPPGEDFVGKIILTEK